MPLRRTTFCASCGGGYVTFSTAAHDLIVVLTYTAESDPLPHDQVISTHCLQNRVVTYT